MDQNTVLNWVAFIIVGGALIVGFLSMLFGKIVDSWDSFARWWNRGVQKAIHTRPVKPHNMSSRRYVPYSVSNNREHGSYAVEHRSEQRGTNSGNTVPDLADLLGTLSDDEILDILARIKDADGNLKYVDSRIAKFIGGRVEDRLAQVRDVRGKEPPPPSQDRVLRVKDNGIERLITR